MKKFKGTDDKYHFVYQTHNIINGKEYTGKHSTYDLDDGYYGSGIGINNAVKKYGIENFAVEILSFHKTSNIALAAEELIVDEDYILELDNYNQIIGGCGDGHIGDISTGKVWIKDLNDEYRYVSSREYQSNKDQYSFHTKNKIVVYDEHYKAISISTSDPRYLSGELKHVSSGLVVVSDVNGNNEAVSVNDPRYIAGELVHVSTGLVSVKDDAGNHFKVSIDDPRYLSGELVGPNKNRKFNNRNRPSLLTCPHCNKEGRGGAMKQWHFDNCKLR